MTALKDIDPEQKEMYSKADIEKVKGGLVKAEEWWSKGKGLNPSTMMGTAPRKKLQILIAKMENTRSKKPAASAKAPTPAPYDPGADPSTQTMALASVVDGMQKLQQQMNAPPQPPPATLALASVVEGMQKLQQQMSAPPQPPPAPVSSAFEQTLISVMDRLNSQAAPAPAAMGPAAGNMEVSMEEYTSLKAEKIAGQRVVASRAEDKAEVKASIDAQQAQTTNLVGAIVGMAKGAMTMNHRIGMALTPSSDVTRARLPAPSSQGSDYEDFPDGPMPATSLLALPQGPAPPATGSSASSSGGGGQMNLTAKVQAIKTFLGISELQPKLALMEAAKQVGMSTEGLTLPAIADALMTEMGI